MGLEKSCFQVLVDMDNVVADFDGAVDTMWFTVNPQRPKLPRVHFSYKADYSEQFHSEISAIYRAKGFFENLPEVVGAVETLRWLSLRGHRVVLCSSPLSSNPYCLEEKLVWVETHLGAGWIRDTIITDDKTRVEGDMLIDDKPEIKGQNIPTWEHIVYTQPYNEHITNKRRITWENWRQILTELL